MAAPIGLPRPEAGRAGGGSDAGGRGTGRVDECTVQAVGTVSLRSNRMRVNLHELGARWPAGSQDLMEDTLPIGSVCGDRRASPANQHHDLQSFLAVKSPRRPSRRVIGTTKECTSEHCAGRFSPRFSQACGYAYHARSQGVVLGKTQSFHNVVPTPIRVDLDSTIPARPTSRLLVRGHSTRRRAAPYRTVPQGKACAG